MTNHARTSARGSRWLLALALFAASAAVCVSRFYPALPNPLTLEFVLDPTDHGNQSDPIITSGVEGRGDFLYLHRADPGVIFIGYDSWNSDELRSPRLPLANGTRHRLRIEMPALDQFEGNFSATQPGGVRVWLDEALVLEGRAHFYVRQAEAIHLGENPLGGTSAEPHFGGKLFDASGREIRGRPEAIFSLANRARGWLTQRPGHVFALALLCIGLAPLLSPRLWRDRFVLLRRFVVEHRWFCGGTALCVLVFSWFVTMGGFDFAYPESFCTFYDFQARSLLQGRLDVPEECLSGEVFRVDGKSYGYFGITPALLRLPFAIFDLGLGRLSRGFMLIDYVGALTAAYLIFLTTRRMIFGAAGTPRSSTVLLFIINVGLGSTLLFLASRSYIYHEAILCGVAFALFSTWCALRYWAAPASRWWIGAGLCGVLSLHARPPTGMFALAFLGLVALAHQFGLIEKWRRRVPAPRPENEVSKSTRGSRRTWSVVALCTLGLLSFNVLAYLKFKTFDGQPLRYNVSYKPERLARFDERKFHVVNIPYVAHAYLVATSFKLTREFPWFHANTKPTWWPDWTKMDMIEPTVSFPFAMTGLIGLVLFGTGFAWFARPVSRLPIVLLKLAVLPMALLLFAAIAVSHRYTADFCPALIGLAAVGLSAIEAGIGRGTRALDGLLWAATGWAVFVTVALTLDTQGEQLWGVPDEVRNHYQQTRTKIDGWVDELLPPASVMIDDRSISRWSIGLAVVATGLLLFFDIRHTYPPLPDALDLQLTLPTGIAGRSEPLVSTGFVGTDDLLFITYDGPNSARFTYLAANAGLVAPQITFTPGASFPVHLEMPSVTSAGSHGPPSKGHLRFVLKGLEVLHGEVAYHPCARTRVFFGENPVGGTTSGLLFRGQITTPDGRELRGSADALFTFGSKLRTWIAIKGWHLILIVFGGLGIKWLSALFIRRAIADPASRASWQAHAWFVASAALSVLVFTWLMTGGNFRLIYPDHGGMVYDLQARSLLQGRLDVPREPMGGEAFVVDGKAYTYFGPTPALLRLPLILFDVRFGHLTRVFMIAEYFSTLLAAYLILGYVTRLYRGRPATPSAWAIALMIATTGLGSTLLFLGSRVYVYHEAILCGVAFALWSGYFSLRYLECPTARWWMGALVCGVLSLQARAPAGLFALGLLGSVALIQLLEHLSRRQSWRRHSIVGLMACAGFLTLPAVSYLKFKTIDGNPVRYNPQYSPERLAKIEGRSFHAANIPHNFDAYFVRPAFQAVSRFPFFLFDLKPPAYPKAKIDLAEPTVSVLYAMSGLVLLTIGASASARRSPTLRRPLAAIALASLPLLACLLMFIATSHRYTADFCPPLILMAAGGLAVFDAQRATWRVGLLALATAATVFAFALTLGLSFHFQADLVWGVPEEVRANFLQLRDHTDRWFGVTAP